jgi:anti-anti-sigma factor
MDGGDIVVIEHAVEQGREIIRVRGEIDLATAPRLEDALTGLKRRIKRTIIDLNGCTFVDASGIRVLKRACERGAVVVCPPGHVRRVLELVSFHDFCQLHATAEEALAA